MSPRIQNNVCNETEDEVMVDKSHSSAFEERRPKNEKRFLVKIRDIEKKVGFVTPLKWTMVINMLLSHIILLTWFGYNMSKGIYPKWQTILFVLGYGHLGAFGVTAGAHRLWSHRSYKAAPVLRWILGIFFCIANEHKLYEWVRDHRVHHKFSETSADPYDSTRGFFFAHMGWLMMMKHPDVIKQGRKIDMSDISSDPVIQFNSKYHIQLKLLLCAILPICLPVLLWGETWNAAAMAQVVGMHYSWHVVWSVNSFAHLYGFRPYDPKINPAQCWYISLVAIGEGWHNYHHTFPWDYKTAELPYFINVTTLLLDGLAKIGLVSHRKVASPQVVKGTIERNCTKKSVPL